MKARTDEPVSANRIPPSPVVSPTSSNSMADKEGAIFAESVKECLIIDQNKDFVFNDVSVSGGEENMSASNSKFEKEIMFDKDDDLEGRKSYLNKRKSKKKGGRSQKGPLQAKFISVDNRPKSKKKTQA
ncbi:hypothetical protein Hanom_Chr10g00900171 [Helianthus anomalus]